LLRVICLRRHLLSLIISELPPFPFPPLFVPPDNYRIGNSSLIYYEDFKIDVPLTVWWTKGGRSPTAVHQTVNAMQFKLLSHD
jgi:hypothetical protein